MLCVLLTLFVRSNGGVQLGDLSRVKTQGECQALVQAAVTPLPCECRYNDNRAASCHPHCCPLDRCYADNSPLWSPYEQAVCRPRVTLENFAGDGPCLYNGGNPFNVRATNATTALSTTHLEFALSQRPEHRCVDLMLSQCGTGISVLPQDFKLKTSTGLVCKQSCPPLLLDTCTDVTCPYRRGRTHRFVRSWDVPQLTAGKTYLLTCVMIGERASSVMGSAVNETQYAPAAFTVPLDI